MAMEDLMMTRKAAFMANPSSSSRPPLSIHRDSRTIAKVKPKIRIIHIFAPEIIKTDVANFRELVQRLTGKPSSHDLRLKSSVSGRRRHGGGEVPRKLLVEDPRNLNDKSLVLSSAKMEPLSGGFISNFDSREDYFSGTFSDIEHFIQDISELPLLPMDPSHHHIHSSFQASQLT